MKHLNHKLISVGVAALSGADGVGLIGVLVGSTLPDLDIPLGIPHRTITHWWPVYAGLAVACRILPLAAVPPVFVHVAFWVCIGALLHILEDSLTIGGVPLVNPFSRDRFSFKLTRTGGTLEYLLSVAVVGSLAVVMSIHPHYLLIDDGSVRAYVQGFFSKLGGGA